MTLSHSTWVRTSFHRFYSFCFFQSLVVFEKLIECSLLFIPDTMTWEELIVKGSIPPKRCGHGTFVDTVDGRSRMFIFGGWGEKGVRLNDMYALDIR